MRWFADLVESNYASAVALYVAGVFFVLIAVGQEWLRLEYHKGVPSELF